MTRRQFFLAYWNNSQQANGKEIFSEWCNLQTILGRGKVHIIKLGGSLLGDGKTLGKIILQIAGSPQTVVVGGGGVFAEQVRHIQKHLHFDDQTASDMAILAMQQTALLLASFAPNLNTSSNLAYLKQTTTPVIWSPSPAQLSEIPANWRITSDSLAAWLATTLSADKLTLVKSAQINTANIATLQQQGVVDLDFARFTQGATYQIAVVNKQQFLRMSS